MDTNDYQDGKNGPLNAATRARLGKFRELGCTLKEIGDAFKMSGPFVSQMLNEKSPARVRSIHVPRIVEAIERGERDWKIKSANARSHQSSKTGNATLTLEDHIRAIDALGFTVTVTPKPR
ncbi:hypothetical protein NLM16_27855 [Bradyrhizobium brasilense]|uniref:hypothetical protein n=1 Tax=Bradyrhizobium brasilense TaxID=1419277 RepID=UPI0028772F94|nr:hypothetical protein [Bradyrhizobium brasilense]MCP3417927.1 hypothetical protein [Bradyrhizobium brasilense]